MKLTIRKPVDEQTTMEPEVELWLHQSLDAVRVMGKKKGESTAWFLFSFNADGTVYIHGGLGSSDLGFRLDRDGYIELEQQ